MITKSERYREILVVLARHGIGIIDDQLVKHETGEQVRAEHLRRACEELGTPPEQLFASFEPNPLGSASIAQVHAARLRDLREVVIKVRKPHVDEPDEREAEITIRKQIEQLIQLNEGQPYTYDRTALIKMLDDALAQARPRTP